ncbi:glycosyltransferase [Fulvimonas soli]|uniref:GT2 family glycosyltransferase n=1 Tax=Fulvimonas soli TaxID=155197 RepID=A0A316HPC4_9GAMM|nr:glycosyltransferase [Fulvimonas soli]PWK83088.1 GT2 family glycosyltransferase [Fulvimonas soli]TNY26131.1 hypothetical protein BV497_10330 [Fulvimonas soli]
MQTEERLAQNHAEFQARLDRMEKAIGDGKPDAAIELAQAAASIAWLKGCGIFSSPRLEALLARIGHALPQAAEAAPRADERRRVLTVMTSAHAIGGHTRLACRWMALDTQSVHTLVLTRQGDAPLPPMVEALAESGRVQLVTLDDDSLLERAARLRRLLGAADRAVLHTHPNDPLPVVALAGMASPPPVLFENHADHVFWIGASVSNLLVSLHDDGTRIAVTRRGVARPHIGWLPIPLDFTSLDAAPAVDIRARYGIPDDAVLLLSCGSAYKFMPIDGLSMADLLAPVLEEHPGVHVLLVGLARDPAGTSLAADYPGRVHLAGYLQQDALHAAYAACDIYLDAVPTSSSTALCEAIAAGKPALKFSPAAWGECGFAMDMDAVPLPLYVSHDADGYRQELRALIGSPALRAQRGRLMAGMLRLCHGDAHFQAQVEALYERAARLPRIELDEATAAHRVELLDVLLGKLADNLEAAQRLDKLGTTGLVVRALSPDEQYRHWLAPRRLSTERAALARSRIAAPATFHVLVVDADGDADRLAHTLQSLDRQSHPATAVTVLSDVRQALPGGIATHPLAGDWATALNAVAATASADWLLPLYAGDALDADALLLLAGLFAAQPDLACCYADEDAWLPDGPAQPVFKPDMNLDLLRSYPYIGRTLAMRRESLLAAGGLRAEAGALAHCDHLFRCVERFGLHTVGHLAEVVYRAAVPFAAWLATPEVAALSGAVVSAHLDRLGVPHRMQPGALAGSNRITYLHEAEPAVSIIVPTRDQLPMLNGLIDSLLAKTRYRNYELLIVDNDSRDPAACAYLDGIERLNNPQLRVLRWPHPFNYSAINNFAAAQARGEYLVLLNNDTAVLHEDWIEALLNHAQRPEVGIVGAKLHYPDGRIQHAGVVLGLRGPADHPFIGDPMDAPGYMHRLQVDQNYTAVTAACLMIRKSVYEEVGGLDEENFKVSYNDVDLCLKVHRAGYLTVWTPYARLMHEGSVSQRKVDRTAQEAKRKRFEGEQRAMYAKWLPLLARDPAYNRNLSLDGGGFDLDPLPQQAWQPFEQPLLPRMFCVAADAQGCGHYRIRQPFLAMQREGLAEGMIAPAHLLPVPMERFAPSSIVLQRQLGDGQLAAMRNYRDFSRAFKVYELDDYLPNLPLKSVHRSRLPKDILKSLRQAVALTDRFVVSTAPLAEQFADMHPDIRVVANRLPVDWWGQPASRRRGSARPRVGWAGGSGHRGDLELIADVVRDLAGEVEWVFLGMCPEKLRPYVHELHEGVPIGQYPAKLASLDLDLALAPLEDNVFNACKSNLRLLEYGACGFPVVCSDIVCYRGGLPVTRVRNRYKEWVDAIRMHLADLDATARMGDALREAVRRDWMLAGAHLNDWLNAWMPA